MRFLGLDLGTRTLGISISDKMGIVASTYKTIRFEDSNYASLIPELIEIITKEQIECVVLGLPKNMNNTYGEATQRTMEFKTLLEKNITTKIVLQDERLTTVQADNYMIEAGMSRKKKEKNRFISCKYNITNIFRQHKRRKLWKMKK